MAESDGSEPSRIPDRKISFSRGDSRREIGHETETDDIIFLVADKSKIAENVLGALRLQLWNKYVLKGNPPKIKDDIRFSLGD